MNTLKNGSEQQSTNSEITIPRRNLIELYSLIHGEGLWNLLSQSSQDLGSELYRDETGEEIGISPGCMKYSMEQHMAVIERILPQGHKMSDFWKIVTSITWICMAIEKNPLLAQEIKTSDDPSSLITAIESRSKTQ